MRKPTLFAALASLWLAACAQFDSYVAVQPLDLKSAYREYTASILSADAPSWQTQQVLNLVPKALEASSIDARLQLLSDASHVDANSRNFALSELALAEAQANDSRDPRKAQRYYLLAAYFASQLLFTETGMRPVESFDLRYSLATGFFNLSAGRYFLGLLEPGSGWDGNRREQTAFGEFSVQFDSDDSVLRTYFFDEFRLAWEYRFDGLRNRYLRDGVGVPLIAWRKPADEFPQEKYFPSEGYFAPVTMALRFLPAASGITSVEIALHDPRNVDAICMGTREVTLAADFSAPIAYELARAKLRVAGRRALLGARDQRIRFGLRLTEPYDPQRIPLVLVHGLASSVEAWRELTNDIVGAPELRKRYQVWHYMYPTSDPVMSAASEFRRSLREFLDSEARNEPPPPMVVVGHSMGGLLAKSLTVDSGLAIWNAAFTVPPEQITLTPDARQVFESAFILKPWPEVGRVIFMGVPQRGSDQTRGALAAIGNRLIGVSQDLSRRLRLVLSQSADQIQPAMRPWFERGRITSIQSLDPDYPLMRAFGELPVAPDIPFHSIIGSYATTPAGDYTDGYVTRASASLLGAISEVFVPVKHRDFDLPEPLSEVYRILREHAADVAPQPTLIANNSAVCPRS